MNLQNIIFVIPEIQHLANDFHWRDNQTLNQSIFCRWFEEFAHVWVYPTPTDLWRSTEKSQKRKEQNLSVRHQQLRHIPCYHGYNKEISTDFHLSIIALHLLHKFIHTTKWKWLISYANVMNTKRSQKTLCHIHSIQLIHIKSLWQEWMGLCVRVMNFPWITFTENNFVWVTLVPLKERQQLNVSENHSERNLCQQSDNIQWNIIL